MSFAVTKMYVETVQAWERVNARVELCAVSKFESCHFD
jgi:hypothetical protein